MRQEGCSGRRLGGSAPTGERKIRQWISISRSMRPESTETPHNKWQPKDREISHLVGLAAGLRLPKQDIDVLGQGLADVAEEGGGGNQFEILGLGRGDGDQGGHVLEGGGGHVGGGGPGGRYGVGGGGGGRGGGGLLRCFLKHARRLLEEPAHRVEHSPGRFVIFT